MPLEMLTGVTSALSYLISKSNPEIPLLFFTHTCNVTVLPERVPKRYKAGLLVLGAVGVLGVLVLELDVVLEVELDGLLLDVVLEVLLEGLLLDVVLEGLLLDVVLDGLLLDVVLDGLLLDVVLDGLLLEVLLEGLLLVFDGLLVVDGLLLVVLLELSDEAVLEALDEVTSDGVSLEASTLPFSDETSLTELP